MIQGVKVIATVDDGSEIVSIRQDIWERIGLPIRSDKIMIMESANKTRDQTMGLLQDLKINIGGVRFLPSSSSGEGCAIRDVARNALLHPDLS